jgi:hypothetical protein
MKRSRGGASEPTATSTPLHTSDAFRTFWMQHPQPFAQNASSLLHAFCATVSGESYERYSEMVDAVAWLSTIFPQQRNALDDMAAAWQRAQHVACEYAKVNADAYMQRWVAAADIAAARVEVYRCEPWIGDLRLAVEHLAVVDEEHCHQDLDALLRCVDADTRADILSSAPDLRVWRTLLAEARCCTTVAQCHACG